MTNDTTRRPRKIFLNETPTTDLTRKVNWNRIISDDRTGRNHGSVYVRTELNINLHSGMALLTSLMILMLSKVT